MNGLGSGDEVGGSEGPPQLVARGGEAFTTAPNGDGTVPGSWQGGNTVVSVSWEDTPLIHLWVFYHGIVVDNFMDTASQICNNYNRVRRGAQKLIISYQEGFEEILYQPIFPFFHMTELQTSIRPS